MTNEPKLDEIQIQGTVKNQYQRNQLPNKKQQEVKKIKVENIRIQPTPTFSLNQKKINFEDVNHSTVGSS